MNCVISGYIARSRSAEEQTDAIITMHNQARKPRSLKSSFLSITNGFFIVKTLLLRSWLAPLLAILLFPAIASFAADTSAPLEKRSLKDCLQPAPKNGGFRMEGYILWCSTVVKVGDTFHLFASRWPAQYGMNGWTTYSECVRATSKNLYGPYEFQEVVLQKRPGHWDKSRVHNVKLVQIGTKLVLYYINTANETGYAVADAVTGPWARTEKAVMKVSNPAILVRPDNSIYVFGRLGDSAKVNRGVAFIAPSYDGPYTTVANGDNLLPNGGELEDPTIWWANNQYNILLNDWKGHATGTGKAGAQYFSKDGMHYQLMSQEPVFTKTVPFDDGTSETFSRRERPFVYVNEKGEVLALFTACLPRKGAATIEIQPVDHYYPGN
jgi:hypothetical protein